ncbi:MAG: copper-binding protein [Pseudomonadota bacterium]
MKRSALAFALLAAFGLAQATSHQHDMAAHETQAAMPQGTGVVKALKTGKVQIAHEPIPALDWPAMTMWFDLKSPAAHDIKVGDRVRFEMMQDDRKKWAIVKMEHQ